jgi:hypothetical protein
MKQFLRSFSVCTQVPETLAQVEGIATTVPFACRPQLLRLNLVAVFALLLCAIGCGGGSSLTSQKTVSPNGGASTPASDPPSSSGPTPSSSTGTVQVSLPTAALFFSGVEYAATAATTCPKGIERMGIYTGAKTLAYSTNGAKLATVLNLAPGTYQTAVTEWDNCGGTASTTVALTVAQPSTTLEAQTSNNTSTANSFRSLSNNDEGATNISKADMRTLLYTGSKTQIYAELQPWFGDQRHMEVGYTSWDPAQVEKQLVDMQSRGVTGVIIDWYGPADPTEPTTLAWLDAANNHPGFKIIIMIDKGAVSLSPCPGCNPQQTMVYLTNHILQNYAKSRAYATLDGKPIITQFDLDLHYNLDWNAVEAQTSPNIAWIFENSDGFMHPITSGSWSWVNISANFGFDYLNQFYTIAQDYAHEMTWGATYKGFNDTLASWGQGRIINQQCGETWLQTFKLLNSYYSSSKQLPILQLVTWNDYEEGTEIESGIDNCLSISANVSGSKLQWAINGNEDTVSQYVVYLSVDGENLLALNTLPVGSRSLDLAAYHLAGGSYTAYVQAVGKPVIKNQMSAAVEFTVP